MTRGNSRPERGPRPGRSSEDYRPLFGDTPLPMWIYDPETLAFLDVNEAAVRHYGYSREEFLSMTIKEIRPAGDVPTVAEVASVPFEGIDETGPWRHRKKDGTLIWVETTRHGVSLGGKRAYLILAHDVSDRKQALRELNELDDGSKRAKGELTSSREQLETILGAVADGVVARDASGRVAYANEPAAGILGYPSAHALLGTPAEEVFGGLEITDETGGELPERELPAHKVLRGEGDAEALVRLREAATGEERWTLVKARPVFDEHGRIRLAVSILHDVTDLRRAQEQLEIRSRQRAAVAELGRLALGGVGLATLMEETVRCTVQGLQTEYCKVLELLPRGDVLLLRAGVGWKEGLVGRARVEAGAHSQAGYSLLSREPVVSEDLRTERRFEASWLLKEHGVVGSVSVVIEGRERPFGVLGAHTTSRRNFTQDDVNFLKMVANVLAEAIERTRAEEEVRSLNRRLEEKVRRRTAQLVAANEDLEAFTRMVSHDLRNRLTSLTGFCEMLLEDYAERVDQRGRHYMRSIAASSERMYALTADLLEFSMAGQGDIRRERVDLSALAREVARELEAAQPEREVEFVAREGLEAEGDPRLLRVVLENLLGNALKFTGKRTSASVEFGAFTESGETRFFVRDDGAGFDMAQAERLFEPFERSHKETDFRGTGIGLATVERIVERHGGRVWAEGAVGEGATFYFALPPAPEEER